ncbi:MAG: hypothetical protein WBE98_02135, partial [Gammaproteobacteria bacterium]
MPSARGRLAAVASVLSVFSFLPLAAMAAQLIVGAAGEYEHDTIQSAVDAANPGDTIIVKPGVYEGFHINKPLSVTGEPGAIIRGPFRADNAIPDGVPVDVWLQPRTSYAAASSTGIRISVGDVEVSGFTIEAFNYGVNLAATTNVANISLSNLVITDVVTGITAASNVELSNLSFNGLHISHGASGILFENKSPGTASIHHLTIDGATFSDLLYKGFYTETLSNSTLRNIVMNKAGYFGRTPKMGQVGAFGNAIDLNLKYGTYENILIENFELTNAGLSIGADTPHEGGGAIVIKAREDGSYSSNPASYVGELILRNGTISGTSTGLRIGEPGVAGLSGVNVRAENVKVTDYLTDGFAAFENLTDETLTLIGSDGDDLLVASAADDRLAGGAGNDELNGGEGTDTAVFSGTQADYKVEYAVDLGQYVVTDLRSGSPDGVDVLKSVELAEFADGTATLSAIRAPVTFVVDPTGAGQFTSLQEAVDAALEGDTITVKDGLYEESVTINKSLTVVGEPGATIRGTFMTDNKIPDGVPLDEWMKTATAYFANSGSGVVVAASNVEVRGLVIEGFTNGVMLTGGTLLSGIKLSELELTNIVHGIVNDQLAQVDGLEITDIEVSHAIHGIALWKAAESTATAKDVTVDGAVFTDILEKGMYFETLSDSVIRDVEMYNVGQFGRAQPFGGFGVHGNAIDFNLKYGTYSGILIENFEFTNVGLSNGAGAPHAGGGAIVVKAREDGSYASNPASYVGELILRNGTISGTSTGLRIGEPGVAGLSGVNVRAENVKVEGHLTDGFAAFENLTDEALTLVGTDETDVLVGTAGSDRLVGGAGNDTLNGGEGEDVAVYSGNQSDYVVQYRVDLDAFLVQDTRPEAPDGLDILVGVELGEFADGTVALAEIREPVAFIVDDDGEGHFTSLQDAISAARDGDSIMVMPGLYVEETKYNGTQPVGLVIDKSVSIVGVTEALEAILSAEAVQATIRSGVESSWGTNFYVTAPDVAIVGLRFEAVARGNDASLPAGAVNKAFEVVAGGFALNHSVVASAPGYNYDGWTSTAIYFGDEDPDDLESFVVVGNVLEGGITITNGAGDSGAAAFAITGNTLSGTHFLRVRGQVDGIGWLKKHAGLPALVTGNDLTGVSGYLFQNWDSDPAWLADRAFVEMLVTQNITGPYAYLTTAEGEIATVEYEEYGGSAPAVLVMRDAAAFDPVPPGLMVHLGDTLDTDGDGLPDFMDDDIDGDGLPNVVEGDVDTDGDGLVDSYDLDSDGDGIPDAIEGDVDFDGDGTPDFRDTDSDNDGIPDSEEGLADSDLDGTPDYLDTSIDEDGDGIPDIVEGTYDSDGDGLPDFMDTDSDNDGVPDRLELGWSGDHDGDGIIDAVDVDFTGGVDLNGDGIDDAPLPDTDFDGLSDLVDPDQDNDGLSDFIESGALGIDSDGDGIDDAWDASTLGAADENGDGIADDARLVDSDADGVPDVRDRDSDRDGIADSVEGLQSTSMAAARAHVVLGAYYSTFSAPTPATDTDGDGTPDFRDLDSDNDGIPDVQEAGGLDLDGDGLLDEGGLIIETPIDTDGDGIPDYLDLDSDGDGVFDIAGTVYAVLDQDGDGRIDEILDEDGDGIPDIIDGEPGQRGSRVDNDADGVPALQDQDDDDDGIPDVLEGDVDTDGDGTIDRLDRDSDNDGISDRVEAGLPMPLGLDLDFDGIDDAVDATMTGGVDEDGDGVDDRYRPRDTDGDGVPDHLDADSDDDGVPDAVEVSRWPLSGRDLDGDGIDDAIDVTFTFGIDANRDGIDDAAVSIVDTDGDGVPDYLDPDSDNDGIPDGLENGDFNGNGINDRLEKDPGVNTSTRGGGGSMGLLSVLLLGSLAAARRLRRGAGRAFGLGLLAA